MKDQHYQFQEA